MPEGQYSGTRATYIYVSDSNASYLLTLDTTLGDIAGTGLTRATTGNSTGSTPAPKRFQPRCVYWQGDLGGKTKRKRIVCNRDGTLFATAAPATVNIDGVSGSTTGRRGEKFTFGSLPAANNQVGGGGVIQA